jgi:hypothetical protein
MPVRMRSSRAMAMAIAVAVVAACSGASVATPIVTTSASGTRSPSEALLPTIEAATAVSPTPVPTPTNAATSAAPSATAAIPDGLYVTAPMNVADMKAAILGDAKLDASQKTQIIADDFVLDDHVTSLTYIDLHNGQYTESGSYDDGPRTIGSRGTYAFADDHTLVIQEPNHLTTFEVAWAGPNFTLTVVPKSTAPYTELDVMEYRLLFESAPFTLVP